MPDLASNRFCDDEGRGAVGGAVLKEPVAAQYDLKPGFLQAAKDVAFCQRTGIINCKPGGVFDPKANATRAENAAVMERMIESILLSLKEA